jgi:hypothetical protein
MIPTIRSLILGLLAYFLCCVGSVSSQAKKAASLTRDDVVIRRNKATLFICADRKLIETNGKDKEEVLWLRLHNNTIWTIRFGAEKKGTFEKSLNLSNGKVIPGLTGQSVAFPRYEIEANKTGTKSQMPEWGDFGTASWLPSNTSAVFSVPIKYINKGTLFLQYKYEWEFSGAIGDESHAPIHRVYFDIANISEIPGHMCDQ